MGGRKAPDFKNRGVSGPGPFSRRTDMDNAQPIRAPGGQDYGERTALEQQQAAAPVPEGGAMGEAAPAGASTSNLTALLGSVGSQRPDEDVTTGSERSEQSPPLVPRDLIEGLEYLIQSSDPPSQDLVDTYLKLRASEL